MDIMDKIKEQAKAKGNPAEAGSKGENVPPERELSPEVQDQIRALRATGNSGVTNLEELKDRMTLYLTYAIEQNHVVKYGNFSRRFSVMAAKFGSTVRAVTESMIAENRIHMIEASGGRIFLTDAGFWNENFEPVLSDLDPAEKSRTIEHIIEHSW